MTEEDCGRQEHSIVQDGDGKRRCAFCGVLERDLIFAGREYGADREDAFDGEDDSMVVGRLAR